MSRMMRGVAPILLLALTGCSSLQVTPNTAPHYLYLGTAAVQIGLSDQGDTNEELV